MRVYIGWDPREQQAYDVAEKSLRKHASVPVDVVPLRLQTLREQMMIWRRFEERDGKLYDCISHAFCSTEFAISRFYVPLLTHSGWSLFVDSDVVFLDDVAKLFALADDRYAAMCVQHPPQEESGTKMDGQVQQTYPRKNWTSVVLWNASHAANRCLHLGVLNNTPGRDLHRFCWLNDEYVGALPAEWNWLVGVQEKPAKPAIAHFTLGTPDMIGDDNCPFAEIWREAEA